MPLFDLVGTGVSLRSGALLKLPTVRAFFRALQVFGPEIAAVRQAIKRSPDGGLRAEVAVSPFMATRTDGRVAYVLEGLIAPEAFKTEAGTQEALLGLVALLAPNLDAVSELLGDPEDADGLEPGDVDPGVQRVLALADRLKIDPMAIAAWPLGVFLDALAHYSAPADRVPHYEQEERGEPVAAVDPLHIPGLGG